MQSKCTTMDLETFPIRIAQRLDLLLVLLFLGRFQRDLWEAVELGEGVGPFAVHHMQLRHRLPVPARRDDFKGDPETVSSNMASWQNSWEKWKFSRFERDNHRPKGLQWGDLALWGLILGRYHLDETNWGARITRTICTTPPRWPWKLGQLGVQNRPRPLNFDQHMAHIVYIILY